MGNSERTCAYAPKSLQQVSFAISSIFGFSFEASAQAYNKEELQVALPPTT